MPTPLTAVYISRSALLHNARVLARLFRPAKMMVVVKSNAYGHGMSEVTRILSHEKSVSWFGVINTTEALQLRKQGVRKPILVLSYFRQDELKAAIMANISIVAASSADLHSIEKTARSTGKKARVHLKIDTGASRIGVLAEDALAFIRMAKKSPHLIVEGLFSHFSDAEENSTYTKLQLRRFQKVMSDCQKEGIRFASQHIAASAAGMLWPESRLSLVRAGIAIYGLWPSTAAKKSMHHRKPSLQLKPVLSWQTQIISIKTYPAGTPISYGGTFITKRASRIAVLPIGYNEGFDRGLSNIGEVLIAGKRCPVRGRVCMNLTMVDVTNVSDTKVGSKAVLIGRQGREEITADKMTQDLGTINYEVVTRVSSTLTRIVAK